MICQDVRDRFSALLDGALGAAERDRCDAHLADCAECAREWERFRQTVALVRGLGPVHAPAGFVSRVLAAAGATPRARLVRRLFFPLPLKLPLEAAALLLVAVGAVYVFQRTPEIREAARHEAPAPAPPTAPRVSEAPAAPKSAVAPDVEPRVAPPRVLETPGDAGETGRGARHAFRPTAEGQRAVASRAVPETTRLSGRLVVENEETAAREVATLAARVGGAEISRRVSGDALVVEIELPGTAWVEFARALSRIGAWSPDREPSDPSARLHVVLRITR